jgi:hypothetical protein
MSTTMDGPPGPSDREAAAGTPPATIVKALLSCGVLYALLYVVANDLIAAEGADGYDRMSQAVSELSATGAPDRTFLNAMLPIWTALMIAFGIGVCLAARGSRALRVTGGLLVAFGVTGVLWLAFPMTSRADMVAGATSADDVGHIVLKATTVLLILAQIGSAALASGSRFRLYSLLSALTVFVFGALTGMESSNLPAGEPTPWMGLFERISIGAWLLWLVVLAITLLRSPAPSIPRARQ